MPSSQSRKSLSARQTAARLGVRVETVYAYVSREILSRTVGPDGRTSRFDAAEVERLARRGRPRKNARRIGTVDVSMATALTRIEPDGRFEIRGESVAALAPSHGFEQIAELLFRGVLPARVRWRVTPDAHALRVARRLPPSSPPVARLVAVASALARPQSASGDPSDDEVHRAARVMISTFVECLPRETRTTGTTRTTRTTRKKPGPATIAARLWPRLSRHPPTRTRIRALDTALLLLADHELATSTLASRVAASTRADPAMAVIAGLATVSGRLHGRAPAAVQRLLDRVASAADPERAAHDALQAEAGAGAPPGFGHPVYEVEDPRASVLLARVEAIASAPEWQWIDTARRICEANSGHFMNIDFALGALGFVGAMPDHSTEAIFAIARTPGWIAHALEEYSEAPLRFRARAIYDGED